MKTFGKIFIFMHENFIFMHGNFIFMPQLFHAGTFLYGDATAEIGVNHRQAKSLATFFL